MANKMYWATALTGGTSGALDAIDGNLLADNDGAMVIASDTIAYIYRLESSSGASESSPTVISPDSNPGDKRWLLCGIKETVEVFIPIDSPLVIDGASAPDALATYTSTNGKVDGRTFANDSSEDVRINWEVPNDIVVADGVKFQVCCVVNHATGPSSEGIAFSLSGYSIGDNDAINGTFGTEVIALASGTYAQYDRLISAWSAAVTVTDLAVNELVMFKFYRDHDHASDDYGQTIAVTGIRLKYNRLTDIY